MKPLMITLLTFATLLLLASTAQAADRELGFAQELTFVRNLDALGCRAFGLSFSGTSPFDTSPACTPTQSNTDYFVDAGACITTYFYTRVGGAPTDDAPNSVTLSVYAGESTTLIRTLHTGGLPADGTTYSLCGTSTGIAGGAERAGPMRLRVQVADTGITPWSCDSDTQAMESCAETTRSGWLRSDIKLLKYDRTSTYPGSGHAWSTTSTPENIVFEPDTTPPFTGLTGTTIRAWFNHTGTNPHTAFTSSTTAVAANGEHTYTDAIDSDYSGNGGAVGSFGSYDVTVLISGPANGLTFANLTWTHWASTGHVTGPTLTSSTGHPDNANKATQSGLFDADGRAALRGTASLAGPLSVNTDHDVYNRGESVTYTFFTLNARADTVTKSLTIEVRDAVTPSTLEDSQTDTSPYSITYTIASGDLATADTLGRGKFVRISATGNTVDSITSWNVSSLYLVDMHPQLSQPLVTDPYDDTNENFNYIISADSVHTYCHVGLARGHSFPVDTPGTQVTISLLDPDDTLIDSVSVQTGADGWVVAGHPSFDVVPPVGLWSVTCGVTLTGNTGTDTETLAFISAFTGNIYIKIFAPTVIGPGTSFQVGAVFEVFNLGNMTTEPLVPDDLPRLAGFNWTFPNGAVEWVPATNMSNLVDHTETVNGNQYYLNLTAPTEEGLKLSVTVLTTLNGATLSDEEPIRVVSMTTVDVADHTVTIVNDEASLYIPLVFFSLILVMSFWYGYPLVAVPAIITIITLFTDDFDAYWSITAGVMLCLVFFTLTYFAHQRRPDGGFLGRLKRRDNE